MVLLLEQDPDAAKGFSRGNSETSWDNLTTEVNSLGPPIRDTTGWKKVWADYKSALKKKLAHNKREQRATGGGPNKLIHLSELEEQAVELTGLSATVEGIPGSSSHGAPKETNKENHNDTCGSSEESDGINETQQTQHSQPKKPRLSTVKLVELQVEQQQKFHSSVESLLSSSNKNSSDLGHYQCQSANAVASVDATLKEMLSEQQRHNRQMEELTREKLDVKKQILEMQIAYISEH